MMGPTDLFTLSSFLTLQGGALAAIIVPNGLCYFATLNKRWLNGIAFAISEIAAYGIASASDGDRWKWLIAGLNGFVIFSAAMGQNQAASALQGGSVGGGVVEPAQGVGGSGGAKRFFHSWL